MLGIFLKRGDVTFVTFFFFFFLHPKQPYRLHLLMLAVCMDLTF